MTDRGSQGSDDLELFDLPLEPPSDIALPETDLPEAEQPAAAQQTIELEELEPFPEEPHPPAPSSATAEPQIASFAARNIS